jgi:DNA end-binding protein Ku
MAAAGIVKASAHSHSHRGPLVRLPGVSVSFSPQYHRIERVLESLQLESTHTSEIDKFVPAKQVDTRYFDSPYYIAPTDQVGLDAFAVIRDAVKGKNMVGLGRVVMAKRERPVILEPLGKGIRATTLHDPYEVRKEDEFLPKFPKRKLPARC